MDAENSMNTETQDVDKNFMRNFFQIMEASFSGLSLKAMRSHRYALPQEAEHFLSNYSTLREECERLKQENQQFDLRCQQLTQELHQSQVDKQNLERHIQKETLQHKEIVWNLKIEVQKSQEERLLWKEKYLDLCIRSSQNVAKDFMKNAGQQHTAQSKDKETKRGSKRLRRKNLKRKKVDDVDNGELGEQSEVHEQQIDDSQLNQNNEISVDQVLASEHQPAPQLDPDTRSIDATANKPLEKINSSSETSSETKENQIPGGACGGEPEKSEATMNQNNSQVMVEPLNLSTVPSSMETTSEMSVASIVNQLTGGESASVTTCSTQDVVTSTTGYYNIQAGTFDLIKSNQNQNENTKTFILTAGDNTFYTAAVIDSSQGNGFSNSNDPPFVLKTTSSTFDTTTTADAFAADQHHHQQSVSNVNAVTGGVDEGVGGVGVGEEEESDSSSDEEENTEFNFRCNLCNMTFSDEDTLMRHMKSKHTAKTNICKDCGKAYSTRGSLAQHVHHYHRHPNAYACSVCQKKFNRKDFLAKHEKTHTNDREFKCKLCEKTYKTNASLSAHINGSHNETRRFVCDYCGMRTSWRLSYLEHMKLHTGEPRKSGRRKKVAGHQMMADVQQEMAQLDTAAVVQFITTAEA